MSQDWCHCIPKISLFYPYCLSINTHPIGNILSKSMSLYISLQICMYIYTHTHIYKYLKSQSVDDLTILTHVYIYICRILSQGSDLQISKLPSDNLSYEKQTCVISKWSSSWDYGWGSIVSISQYIWWLNTNWWWHPIFIINQAIAAAWRIIPWIVSGS